MQQRNRSIEILLHLRATTNRKLNYTQCLIVLVPLANGSCSTCQETGNEEHTKEKDLV
jgi:hypothetical protein